MEIKFSLPAEELAKLGFVPNKRTNKHTAWCRIGGHTVWCADFDTACKLANRVMKALYARGLNVRYRVESISGFFYQYNW